MRLQQTFFGLLLTLTTATAIAQNVPVNLPIDLTVPMGAQPVNDQLFFDESVSFAPNFAIDQKAPALSDLFGKDGSELCMPTSLAEALIFTQGYAANKVDLGLSQDKVTVDPNALVRQLVASCHTDLQKGTNPIDAIKCLLDAQAKAGRPTGGSKMIDPYHQDPTLPIETRDVTIQDIRTAVKAGHVVLLEVGWFGLDPLTKSLKRDGGHYVGVYGYNYNKSWGDEQIQLKVINPLNNYGTDRTSKWSTVSMARISRQPGIQYPIHQSYTLSGSNFGGLKTRSLVGQLLIVAP